MPKRIVLLSDGTGNSNVKDRGTNVFKLFEAIDFNLPAPDQQVAFYDDGVGTEDFKFMKIMGGAFGWGLTRNVLRLYKELVQCYQPGDGIYLFGFSRGAFTVRTLAGFIADRGILKSEKYSEDSALDLAIAGLYEKYREKHLASLEKLFYKPYIKELNVYENVPIEFIGVWDTVDAVGLPFDGITEKWNRHIFRFKFTNRELNDKVKNACHALSIDDERRSFHPLLWKDREGIEQVWFSGVHSNVGGGYPQQGMSMVALEWMMEKAQNAGLKFVGTDMTFVKDRKNVYDKLYDSRSGFGVYYRYEPRDIDVICGNSEIKIKPRIHISAFQRIAQGVFGYSPGNLPREFEVVASREDSAKPEMPKVANKIVAIVGGAMDGLVKTAGESNNCGNYLAPLLTKVSCLICKRHLLYNTLIVYSIAMLIWVVRGDFMDAYDNALNTGQGRFSGMLTGIFAVIKILVSPDGLLNKLSVLFWDNWPLALVGLVLWGAAQFVRNRQAAVYSRFWSKSDRKQGTPDVPDVRFQLRDVLKKLEPTGVAPGQTPAPATIPPAGGANTGESD